MIRICLASLLIYGLSAECGDTSIPDCGDRAPAEGDCCYQNDDLGRCVPGEQAQCASTPPDETTPSSTATTEEPCEEGSDYTDWTVDYIGKSTQFRIYDPCDGKFIKFKMEDLTEYSASTGKKTNNKETSFASSKDWLWGEGTAQGVDASYQGAAAILNIFQADLLTDGETSFNLTTWFFKEARDVQNPDNTSETISVLANSMKFDTIIENWQYLADDNYLVLCIGIMTNKAGDIDDDPDTKTFYMDQFQFDNAQTASCIDENGDATDINVDVARDGNGNNHLDVCYTFDACAGTIKYDPILQINPSTSSTTMEGLGNKLNMFVAICAVMFMAIFG